MNQNDHKDCFGKMFPDDLHLKNNQPNKGKVFLVWVDLAGGMIRSDRRVSADIAEWDDCRQCPEFESCYKLCLAKTTLESVVATQ